MPSFDTVCDPDMVEVKNAVENAAKEIGTRFDFKGTSAAIELKDKDITLLGDAEFADAHARFQHQAGMSPASPVSGSEGGSERAPEPPVDGPAPAVQISRR